MSRWKNKKLRKNKSKDTSAGQKNIQKKKVTLNPFAKMKAKKEERQREIDRKIELERLELERQQEAERLAQLREENKK